MLITFIKLGNHWYPNIDHTNPEDLKLDSKIEKVLNRIDKYHDNRIDISLIQQGAIVIREGLIQFTDKDILRFCTTNDNFVMDLYISDHKFSITSQLYTLLEQNFNLNLHKEIYRIEF